MKTNFDYQGAKDAGYSDEEITTHLREVHPKFDYEGSVESGYSPEEINEHLSSYKPEKSKLEKAGRVAGQFALGAASNALLPYELAVTGIDSKKAQVARTRDDIAQDVENLLTKKYAGEWSDADEKELESLRELWKNPKKIEEEIAHEPVDISVRGLTERATGLDLHPEGILEKAANWSGFIKNPKNLLDLSKTGVNTKDVFKAIAPTGTEALRGVSAGTALQLAENGNFGPIGTMAAAVVGDLAGGGAASVLKGGAKLLTEPKKTLAEVASKFTSKDKLDLQKQVIKDFRDSGIQADLGSITDSNLVKWTQSRLAQSGLTGKALDDLKESLTSQIKEEYKTLADSLGEAKLASEHEAGLIAREGMKSIREADLQATRNLYANATKALKENASVDPRKLATAIQNLEKELTPGSIKSAEQQVVLNTLSKIKNDIYTPEGKLKFANVKELMNNKIALNDIINYEVQGGAKQLLKNIVGEMDRAIISHGKENIPFVRNYVTANKKFSEHAKTFRNKTASQMLNAENPAQLINKMNSVQGIKQIEKILTKTPEGSKILDQLKRYKLDKVVGDNLVDSTSKQVKMGTFSKLLEKGKNKEIVKELLGPQAFKRLEKLQKNAGKLADAAQKFYNASKSGSTLADSAIIAKGVTDVAHILAGNPWPLLETVGGILGAKKLSGLLADPEFLKLAEEAILASEKESEQQLIQVFERMRPYILQGSDQINERS